MYELIGVLNGVASQTIHDIKVPKIVGTQHDIS